MRAKGRPDGSLYTSAQDTLDPDDPIFPRAATRVGIKYQAVVPPWKGDPATVEADQRLAEPEAGPSRHIIGKTPLIPFIHDRLTIVERGHDIGERKHESTYDVICTPSDEREYRSLVILTPVNTYMDQVKSLSNLPVPNYDVERLNKAASAFTTLGSRSAMKHMASLKLPDYNPIIASHPVCCLLIPVYRERNGRFRETARGEWRS